MKRMANGEWRMANGEWRMANGEWRKILIKYFKVPNLIQLESLLHQSHSEYHDQTG
ncbi:hypothetical protein LDP52_02185 [Photobacterium damselae]|uniref:hypothetical protein n=1 Tax=Photobacterium damselae TaxID=38293 RepID=UPI00234129E7|nr:hypothetical protein [Photobacterium damselae]MDC4167534.1 hypothetical protein [Photobacterium damselae]